MNALRTALLVVAATAMASLSQPSVGSAETIRVAMLPVAINSALENTGHLSAGLADMVAARLEQNERISVIRLDAPVSDREEAIEAARKVGAEYVLFGSYTQFGDGASLDLRCAPTAERAGERPRRVFTQAGNASEIIPRLGVLTESVVRYLTGESTPSNTEADAPVRAPGALDASALADIERRLEALESVIFAPPAAVQSGAADVDGRVQAPEDE